MAKGDADKNKGMSDFQKSIQDYLKNGNSQYNWLGDLGYGPELGDTEMGNIKVDPQYAHFEQQALRDLEAQSKDGLSARDQADLAQLESQVNRQNAGRQGAIQQNMAARGMGGSGMELVAQMQASQDATERQALASMEKAAMAQEGRRGATAQLGQQAGQMSARDFQQQAQKANAQDAINRFNVANQQNVNQYNNAGRQGVAGQNTAQANQFQANAMGAKQAGAQMQYNMGADANNAEAMRKAAARQRSAATGQAIGAVGGAVAGSFIPGIGTAAGATVGGAAGGAAGSYFNQGGVVPGKANVPGDHPANDTVPAMLSPGEVVIPRTAVQEAAKDHGSDAIDSLLKAMASMQKKGKQ
jgi:hypothetical protein